ncbi:hypothetical protein TELCIR_26030, partial [Teladorsagia circumcincta]
VIATVDTKRPLLDISCDHSDHYVAVVERMSEGEVEYMLSNEKTLVRAYEVGKRRDAEDDDVDEVEDEEGSDSGHDNGGDDGNGDHDDEEMNSGRSDESGGANGDDYLLQ